MDILSRVDFVMCPSLLNFQERIYQISVQIPATKNLKLIDLSLVLACWVLRRWSSSKVPVLCLSLYILVMFQVVSACFSTYLLDPAFTSLDGPHDLNCNIVLTASERVGNSMVKHIYWRNWRILFILRHNGELGDRFLKMKSVNSAGLRLGPRNHKLLKRCSTTTLNSYKFKTLC